MLTDSKFESLKTIFKYRIKIDSDHLYVYHDEYDDEESDWNKYIKKCCGARNYATGASKIVLFYKDIENWVVKLPFFGDYYESTGEYSDYCEADKYLPICSDNDYCEAEAYLTNKAIEYGVGDMFAKTYYLGNLNGVPVYISEKIEETVASGRKNYSYSRINSAKETQELFNFYSYELDEAGFSSYNEPTLRFFVDQYGQKKTEKLIQFIMDYQIDDLHSANIGFDKCGKIKIIDYSGFHY